VLAEAPIRFQRPELPSAKEIDRYFQLARATRWFSNGGPCSRLLSERLSDRAGAYCTPVASGTLGLMAALSAVLDERPGGEAWMPSFTFAATAQAALWAGLAPRLLDIDPISWHLDSEQLEESLIGNDDARAVIAVSAFGTPPPAEQRGQWEAACRKAEVPLIVDSAAGFGAVAEDGTPIGMQGDVEVVSFHATKPFAIGEGGAVFTCDRKLHKRIEQLVNFGFRLDRTVASNRGLNAKMSELHAATALAVLDDFDRVLEQRREAASALRAQIGAGPRWQQGCERSTWQFAPLAFERQNDRARVLANCGESVETRVYYRPLDQLIPARLSTIAGGMPHADDLYDRILCLPMANDLAQAEIETIAAAARL
jgi:dTDP-4-amino-4,6-dideoxygalactose transaminase